LRKSKNGPLQPSFAAEHLDDLDGSDQQRDRNRQAGGRDDLQQHDEVQDADQPQEQA
jgi:hypothetical protein